ncbi:MAG TPA: hypothetical protein ENO08_08565, partial [Candidatus Eisenbacteria bacterium]|nr:hypothetical protein [Candidatus Eisenbacteria bacterium]
MNEDKQNRPSKPPPPPKRRLPSGQMPGPQRPSKSMALWVMLLVVFFLAFLIFNSGKEREWPLNYSQFVKEIENGNIGSVKIKGIEVRGTLEEEIIVPTGGEGTTIKNFKVILPAEDKDLPEKIWAYNPDAQVEGEFPGSSVWVKALATALPLIALLVLWVI